MRVKCIGLEGLIRNISGIMFRGDARVTDGLPGEHNYSIK